MTLSDRKKRKAISRVASSGPDAAPLFLVGWWSRRPTCEWSRSRRPRSGRTIWSGGGPPFDGKRGDRPQFASRWPRPSQLWRPQLQLFTAESLSFRVGRRFDRKCFGGLTSLSRERL